LIAFDRHRKLAHRVRLVHVEAEAEGLEHQLLQARVGDVVPQKFDAIQFPRAIHLGHQQRHALDGIVGHRLPADDDVGALDGGA